VRKRAKAAFDPKRFLARVGDGKSIAHYLKNEIVFSQGGVADAVFYIQKGNVKLVVVSKHGKEAVVAILGPGHFWRRMSEWPSAAYRNSAGGRSMRDYSLGKDDHDRHDSSRARVFRNVHVVSVDSEQSD
jgi:hypothetical protein